MKEKANSTFPQQNEYGLTHIIRQFWEENGN